VGVGGFCECQFVDGGRRIRFDFKCPLHENGVYEDGSKNKKIVKQNMEYKRFKMSEAKQSKKTGSDIRGGHMLPGANPTRGH
jgi:hypothetical protein